MSADTTRAARLGAATLHESGAAALPRSLRPVAGGSALAGRARVAAGPAGDNYWLHRAIYAAQPDEVLVVHVPDDPDHGYWGEVMSVAARERGVQGLVVTGGVRDAAAIDRLGFPVFATGLCVRGTTKHGEGGGLDQPVHLGGARVTTGDLVVGDRDGVVAIAADDVERVLAAGEERERAEEQIMRRLAEGESTLEVFGLRPPAADGHSEEPDDE